MISKRLGGGGYSDHLEYDLPQDEGDESERITFRQYLANMTAKTGNMPEINYSTQYTMTMNPLQYALYISLIIRYKQPRSSMYYPVFSIKSYSSNPTISFTDHYRYSIKKNRQRADLGRYQSRLKLFTYVHGVPGGGNMGGNIPAYFLVQSKDNISRQTSSQEERPSNWVNNPLSPSHDSSNPTISFTDHYRYSRH